jgi:hypothetical protein
MKPAVSLLLGLSVACATPGRQQPILTPGFKEELPREFTACKAAQPRNGYEIFLEGVGLEMVARLLSSVSCKRIMFDPSVSIRVWVNLPEKLSSEQALVAMEAELRRYRVRLIRRDSTLILSNDATALP